ncbi:MAG: transporter substrate-binding domain-containing protein [Gammaproteobacteria bacterium]|nr:transporter substrate-binding domain-containing protein [Gammaproteobacteria bacterium]
MAKTIAASLIAAVIASALTTYFVARPPADYVQEVSEPKIESVYDRVMRTNTIRCGYAMYPPAFYADPESGEFAGIMHDLTVKIAETLNLEIEWAEEVSYGDMAQGLEARRYDLICSGKWLIAQQAIVADFSTPVFYTTMGIYAQVDDTRFDSDPYQLINDSSVVIATVDGDINTNIAAFEFPEARTFSLPQLSDKSLMLLNVATDKADVTFADLPTAYDFLHANPGTVRNITPDKPIRVYETAYMLRNGEVRFKNMLNNAVKDLSNNGYVDKLLHKYEKYPGSFHRVANPYQKVEH